MPIDPDVTRLQHVQKLLEDAEFAVGAVRCRVDDGVRLKPKEREVFSRSIAGVIGALESVRIWLASGAPQ